jgi:hypothetical protein
MLTLVSVIVGALLVASLPYWLPQAIIALRMRLFTYINGDERIAIPGPRVDASRLRAVYGHPAANGRSRGAALSDLFWYWLAPGPELHQEHLEPGERYDEVARTTRRLLALPRPAAEALATRCAARVLDKQAIRNAKLVRLRDLMMPVWAAFYYELVFGEPCPPVARALIVANANDVVTALKCCGLRHMATRDRLTRFLIAKLEAGGPLPPLPACFTTEERAFYLQGVFFNTAVVQMSEATAHLLLVIAQHPAAQARLVAAPDDEQYLDQVITETLRLYPLFGIAHRITSADIALDDRTTLPQGAVLCFNYPAYQRVGFADTERFVPERWEQVTAREAHYIPFGVATNRPCPAQGLALITLRAAAREVLRRFACDSSASHTRSLPNRGPCVLVARAGHCGPQRRGALLWFVRVRDRWEDVGRSLVQLVLGTYMVWDARRLRLCARYFETQAAGEDPTERGGSASACPVAGRAH